MYLPALLLPLLGEPALAGLPSQTCSVAQACQAHNNLISAVAGVETVAECRELCADSKDCNIISYFGQGSSPFQNYCMLFTNCKTLHDCSNCWSEEKVCFNSCDNNLEFVFDSALEILTDVGDEPACLLSCKANPACTLFTHYSSVDPNYPNLCVLQSGLPGPLQPCDHCRTGVPDCSNANYSCSFSVGADDTPTSSYKFSETGTPTTVTVSPLAVLVDGCELTVVAIGGGGSSANGGGGSGYVASRTVPASALLLEVVVGGPGQGSTLHTGMGEEVVSAAPGEDGKGYGGEYFGGAGYSGGGGGMDNRADNDGGWDGGDAPGEWGGGGSGLDLSSISLAEFTISPGVAGKGALFEDQAFGGGGGGVKVDGEGPHDYEMDGEGYGGGGSGFANGVPGLVLLEIKEKQS